MLGGGVVRCLVPLSRGLVPLRSRSRVPRGGGLVRGGRLLVVVPTPTLLLLLLGLVVIAPALLLLGLLAGVTVLRRVLALASGRRVVGRGTLLVLWASSVAALCPRAVARGGAGPVAGYGARAIARRGADGVVAALHARLWGVSA